MKVLWLCNKVLEAGDRGATGTWLDALAAALIRRHNVELGNVTTGASGSAPTESIGAFSQWIVPATKVANNSGLPEQESLKSIYKIVARFRPDLIHVWGTESYWGLLTSRALLDGPAVIELQGLKGEIARVYSGGLTMREQLRCVGVREIVRGESSWQMVRKFREWGRFEDEMLRGHNNVIVQSDWLQAQVKRRNPRARIHRNHFALRQPFLDSAPWSQPSGHALYCAAAYPAPAKGLHVALRALRILRDDFPEVQLRIGGAIQRAGLRNHGYARWLLKLVRELGLERNVVWLGPLAAEEIVEELRRSRAAIIPSFVEGYCLSMAEAMAVGVPCVAAFAGALPDLGESEQAALYFPPNDETSCALRVRRIFEDNGLAGTLSNNGRAAALARGNPDTVSRRLEEIYGDIQRGGA